MDKFKQVACKNDIPNLKNGVSRRMSGRMQNMDIAVRPIGAVNSGDGRFSRPYDGFNQMLDTVAPFLTNDIGNVFRRRPQLGAGGLLQSLCISDVINVMMCEQDHANIAGVNAETSDFFQYFL